MKEYPEIWEVAHKIEGLVARCGEHAGGVIFVDESFTKSTALMKVPNGDIVTQFDLHDAEEVSQPKGLGSKTLNHLSMMLYRQIFKS